METKNIGLWYIRNIDDPTFGSVPFTTEREAQIAIDETELFESHEPYVVVFPVTFDPKDMDRRARDWVAENFEHYSVGHWSTEECWEFIGAEHHGGSGGFMVMSSLDKPFTR